MTFLTPLLAGIAAAIAVPSLVILYFLKLRREDVEVSTTLLWKKSIQDLQANAPFQRLRKNLLLLLQLLILAAALFALAQPQFASLTAGSNRQIIMIDRSASMQSTDESDGKGGYASRLDAAKKQAKAIVDALREPSFFDPGGGDQAMVIAFDSTAEVRQQFTTDKRLLRDSIDAITASDAPTALGEAMRLAKAHAPVRRYVDDRDGAVRVLEGVSGGEPVTMQLWSDGRLPDADKAAPGLEDSLVFHRVGSMESENVGLVGLRAERAFDDPAKLSIYVAVQSTAKTPRSVDVELTIDDNIVGVKSVDLPAAEMSQLTAAGAPPTGTPSDNSPAGTTPAASSSTPAAAKPRPIPKGNGVVFSLDRREGAVAQVRLLTAPRGAEASAGRPTDALAADDRGWLVIPPAKKLSVAVVTRGNLFLSTALGGLPLAKLDTLSPDDFERRVRSGKTGEYDVMVLDGVLPSATTDAPINPSTGLPPGRYLVMNASPAPAIVDRGKAPSSGIVDWVRDHPTLRYVSLDNLMIAESRIVDISPGSGGKALVLSDRGPAVVELASADSRAIVIPFDVAQSTWPFDVSFVVFLASSVNYLGDTAASTGQTSRMVQTGGTLSDRLASGASDARIEVPGGERFSLAASPDGQVAFAPVRSAGIYRIRWDGAAAATDESSGGSPSRAYAANLLDAQESDTTPDDQVVLASRTVQAAQGGPASGQRKLWPWLILAGLCIMMLEWFIYNRKVYV
jgi:hypothetical protein